jgi:hypothetical protein
MCRTGSYCVANATKGGFVGLNPYLQEKFSWSSSGLTVAEWVDLYTPLTLVTSVGWLLPFESLPL